MNTATTRWNRSATRLLSAGLFVALAGTAMLSAEASPMDGGGHRHGSGMMGGPMMGGKHSARMLDAVGATAEQKAQIKQIMDAAHTELKAQRDAGRGLHDQMRQLFTQPTVDARAVETLRQQMLAQHDQASKRMMQAMLDGSRVLTPEQRAKMADMAGQRRAMMDRRGQPPK
jgi:Spy/CpxP family protein refolding chaperone